MALKNMLEVNGELYDMWEVRTIQRYQEYNTELGKFEYSIVLNRGAVTTNANDTYILFESEEARDKELEDVRKRVKEMDVVKVY
jgi:hypothetical protein